MGYNAFMFFKVIIFTFVFIVSCKQAAFAKPTHPHRTYYDTGEVRNTGFLKNNRWNGVVKQYDKQGKLILEHVYQDDNLSGPTVYYDEQGRIMAVESLKNEQLEGFRVEFYPSGSIKSIQEFKENSPVGPKIKYNEAGEVIEKDL